MQIVQQSTNLDVARDFNCIPIKTFLLYANSIMNRSYLSHFSTSVGLNLTATIRTSLPYMNSSIKGCCVCKGCGLNVYLQHVLTFFNIKFSITNSLSYNVAYFQPNKTIVLFYSTDIILEADLVFVVISVNSSKKMLTISSNAHYISLFLNLFNKILY